MSVSLALNSKYKKNPPARRGIFFAPDPRDGISATASACGHHRLSLPQNQPDHSIKKMLRSKDYNKKCINLHTQ